LAWRAICDKDLKRGYQGIFKHEIAPLSSLHHPHIMHLVCCADEGEQSSYLMELMHTSISQMLEDTQLFLIRHVDLMLQIAEGINSFIAWT
jgi:hypothetical protein